MRKFLTLMLCVLMALSMCAVASAEEKAAFDLWICADTVPTMQDEKIDLWADIEYNFELAHPEVDLVLVAIGANSDDYNAKFQMAAAANNLPDMVYGSFGYVDDWANAGLLLDLEPIMEEDFWSVFAPGSVDAANAYNAVEGIYGMPTRAEVQGWFYNTELFEKCGLEIPTTWTEFMNCVEVFKENGITPIAHGATDIWAIWGEHYIFCQYGLNYEEAQKLQNHEAYFEDSEIYRNAFGRIAELAAAGAFNEDVATCNNSIANARFAAGEAAMYGCYDTCFNEWLRMLETGESDIANKAVFSFGPTFEDAVYPTAGLRTYGWTLMTNVKVGADEAKTAAVKTFFEWFFGPEGSLIQSKYHVPASAYTAPEGQELTMVQKSLNESYLADILPIPDNTQAYYDQSIKVTYRNAVTGLICGTLTVDEALVMMQDWADTM